MLCFLEFAQLCLQVGGNWGFSGNAWLKIRCHRRPESMEWEGHGRVEGDRVGEEVEGRRQGELEALKSN